MKDYKLAVKWEVKIFGKERGIQLFDSDGLELGPDDNTRWEGDFYCDHNQLTTLAGAPKEVGGDFSCSHNQLTTLVGAPKTYVKNAESLKDLISAKLLMKGILFADGIMAHIVSSKNNVFKISIYGKKEISYCVYRDGNFSHGKTLKEAIESLRYKASIRDVEEFKSWKLSDIKSLDELISAYRSITGACESGVRGFCEPLKLQNKLSVDEVINLTSGRYGHEQFRKFGWKNERL